MTHGSDMAQQAKQQGREAAQKARHQASRLGEQAWWQAKSQVGTRQQRAAQQLDSVAQALRHTGQQLREQDNASFGEYADRAAEQVERVSGYLREKDPDQLISEAENLARRQPALFLGGAFALGLLGARFLKSSAQDGGSEGSSQDATGGSGGAGIGTSASAGGTDTYGVLRAPEPAHSTVVEEPVVLTGTERVEPPRHLEER